MDRCRPRSPHRPASTSARSSPPSIPSSGPPRSCPTVRPRSSRRPAAARRRRWSRDWPCSSRGASSRRGSASSPSTGTPRRTSQVASRSASAHRCRTRRRSRSARCTPSPDRCSSTRARARTSSPTGSRSCAPPAAGMPQRTHRSRCRRRRSSTPGSRPGRWRVARRRPDAEAVLRTYEELLLARGAVDFDDLVVRAGDLLETDPALRLRWQSRFEHVCVDEFQDVDAAQLRLVRLLAAPAGQPLRRRRRRPDDLRLAARRCAANPALRAATTRPRGA